MPCTRSSTQLPPAGQRGQSAGTRGLPSPLPLPLGCRRCWPAAPGGAPLRRPGCWGFQGAAEAAWDHEAAPPIVVAARQTCLAPVQWQLRGVPGGVGAAPAACPITLDTLDAPSNAHRNEDSAPQRLRWQHNNVQLESVNFLRFLCLHSLDSPTVSIDCPRQPHSPQRIKP